MTMTMVAVSEAMRTDVNILVPSMMWFLRWVQVPLLNMWQDLVGSSLDCGLFPGFDVDLARRSRNFAWMASSLARSSWAALMASLVEASSHLSCLCSTISRICLWVERTRCQVMKRYPSSWFAGS